MRLPLLLLFTLHLSTFTAESTLLPGEALGRLMLHGGTEPGPAEFEEFIRQSGGLKAKLVLLADSKPALDALQKAAEKHADKKVASITALQIFKQKDIDNESHFTALKEATGVWIVGNSLDTVQKLYVASPIETALRALLKRGGVVGGSSAGAALLAKSAILNDAGIIQVCKGFEFVPNVTLIIQTLSAPTALWPSTYENPGNVSIEIDAAALLLIHSRSMIVRGRAVLCLAPSKSRPARRDVIEKETRVDLTTLTRAALARTQPPFPPEKISAPGLDSGTLIIDGGGIPKVALTRFIEAAGGPDALILVTPTAQGDQIPDGMPSEGRRLQAAGAKNVKVLHLSHADACDEQKIALLKEAKGLWFAGGRQWRYVDAYLDTPAEKLMHDILKRGGAIGGSSAGATIQGEYLVRGHPLGNTVMMAEGYERGMAFFKGTAIDQHFFKRKRFADMSAVKKAFPQLLGLGIDEGSTVVVNGHTLEIIGVAPTAIYNRDKPAAEGEVDYLTLKPGEKYDLKTKSKIEP